MSGLRKVNVDQINNMQVKFAGQDMSLENGSIVIDWVEAANSLPD